ncbi:hypothetical protein A0H81_03359 [Grifola frondosa]|uniref:Uncharacterized protein n=1 Tax=Grifola frondosa TaxID=5627 RepID=A0A1C7MHN5_GRIFR|nr:hypothetical protein A0H81_03359 [Grifola frondosa]
MDLTSLTFYFNFNPAQFPRWLVHRNIPRVDEVRGTLPTRFPLILRPPEARKFPGSSIYLVSVLFPDPGSMDGGKEHERLPTW